MLNIIMPSMNKSWMTFAVGLDVPSEKTAKVSKKIEKLYKESDLDEESFLSTYYLDLIEIFLYGEVEMVATDIEWVNPVYFEVAEMIEVEIQKYYQEDEHEHDSLISLALFFWAKYCDSKNPAVKNPTLYVAAMIYLIDQLAPYNRMLTQADLAKRFKISSGSISKKYKELKETLWEDIERIKSKLSQLDDDDYEDDDYPSFPEELFFQGKMELEKEIAAVKKAIEGKDFDSFEEVNEFLSNHFNGGMNLSKEELTNKEKAAELIYDAFAAVGLKRKKLAEKALKLYPNSPDAYLILSETDDDPIRILMEGLEAGERDLGKDFFKKNKGHFWFIHETRPYMRVKYQLAFYLSDQGKKEEAIKHYIELLELNPNDNQGVRDELFITYVEVNKYDEAENLLKKFDETDTASYYFNMLLLELIKNGPTKKADQLMKKATKHNNFVIDYLLGKKRLPAVQSFGYKPGDENEAVMYVNDHLHIWLQHKAIMVLLEDN